MALAYQQNSVLFITHKSIFLDLLRARSSHIKPSVAVTNTILAAEVVQNITWTRQ